MTSEALSTQKRTGFALLRQFVRSAPPAEHCALCHSRLSESHAHLVDLETRALMCACEPCSILFGDRSDARYRRVPGRVRRLPELTLAEETWENLAIPINMAFLFYNSRDARPVAVYPSPAGATESSLPLPAWEDIVAAAPALRTLLPDVEALLVNRLGMGTGPEYYIAPIDECYKLVGLVRAHWRGLAGGARVWQELDSYFARLRKSAGNRSLEAVRA